MTDRKRSIPIVLLWLACVALASAAQAQETMPMSSLSTDGYGMNA